MSIQTRVKRRIYSFSTRSPSIADTTRGTIDTKINWIQLSHCFLRALIPPLYTIFAAYSYLSRTIDVGSLAYFMTSLLVDFRDLLMTSTFSLTLSDC